MNLVIVDYGAGNVRSLLLALERAGVSATVSASPDVVSRADKVIIPGVGEASSAMRVLEANGLARTIANLLQPVLGICLGLQLLCESSEEGSARCLGVYEGIVRRFNGALKVPHVGWNRLERLVGPLFEGIEEGVFVYYVHSFFAPVGRASIAVSSYGEPFSAALQRGNFYSVQFHPERSGDVGARIIENFLSL